METESMPPRRQPPTVRRRRLAGELLGLRSGAGMTREQVAAETGLSTGALYKIEKAQTRPQRRTLRALLDLYKVKDPDRRAELEALLRQSGEVGWLQLYEGRILESYAALISFEAEALRESVFELSFIPGLLQTEEYARTVVHALMPEAEDDEVDSRVEIRLRRQQALDRSPKVALWAICDEAAIRRMVGGPAVMRGQLDRLLERARQSNVTLQVVPFGAGAHLGMPGSFHVLEFQEPDPPLIYTENAGGGLFLEQDADVARYRASFQRLAAQALSPEDTVRMIQQAVDTA